MPDQDKQLEAACRALVKSYDVVHGLGLSGEDLDGIIAAAVEKARLLVGYGADDAPAEVAAEAVMHVIRAKYGLDDDDKGRRRHG